MNLRLSGTAQSNARVSAYLQSLTDNELFLNPDLTYVRAASEPENPQEPFDFSVGVTLRTPASEQEQAGFDEFETGGSQ